MLTVHLLTGETLELFVDEALIPSDGLDKNDTICVTYDGWLNGEDVRKLEIEEIEVETKGSNSENSVAGTIWELEEDFFTLRTMDGRTLRFTEKAGEDSVPENVVVGTAVRVYFTGWLTGEDQEENAVVTHVAQLFNNFVQTAVSAVGCGDICGIETAKRAFFCGKVRERGFFSFVVLWYTDKKPKGGA